MRRTGVLAYFRRLLADETDDEEDIVDVDDEEGDRKEGTRVWDPSDRGRLGLRLGGCKPPPSDDDGDGEAEPRARWANSGTRSSAGGAGAGAPSSRAAPTTCSSRGDFAMGSTQLLSRTKPSHLASLRSGGGSGGAQLGSWAAAAEEEPGACGLGGCSGDAVRAVSVEGRGDALHEIREPGRRLGCFRSLLRGLGAWASAGVDIFYFIFLVCAFLFPRTTQVRVGCGSNVV